MLRDHYVALRSTMRKEGQWAVPITVRQLEAIIRITEALAKMTLSPSARPEHVTEAIRLFTVSTVDAAAAGLLSSIHFSIGHAEQHMQGKEVQRCYLAKCGLR